MLQSSCQASRAAEGKALSRCQASRAAEGKAINYITSAIAWRQLRLLEGDGRGEGYENSFPSEPVREGAATARGTGLISPAGGLLSNVRKSAGRGRASTSPSNTGSSICSVAAGEPLPVASIRDSFDCLASLLLRSSQEQTLKKSIDFGQSPPRFGHTPRPFAARAAGGCATLAPLPGLSLTTLVEPDIGLNNSLSRASDCSGRQLASSFHIQRCRPRCPIIYALVVCDNLKQSQKQRRSHPAARRVRLHGCAFVTDIDSSMCVQCVHACPPSLSHPLLILF